MHQGEHAHGRGDGSAPAEPLQSSEREIERRLRTELARLENDLALARDDERRKDEFLTMLAHELRNPLAPLQCTLAVLRGRFGSPALDRHLEMMERQMSSLARIVDDLLDVSRVSRGKITLQNERLEVAPVVMRAIDSTRHRMEERGHDLVVTLPARPIFVLGDRVRLEQVLVNLLVNAAKYTDPGGRVWIEVDRGPDAVELRVRDNGVGMSAETIEHVFELFAQCERDLMRAQGGLGVGLAVVKTLVELHGGTVSARSPGPGRGSEFGVRLPLAIEQTELDLERRRSSVLAPALARRRILVVDDNRDVADALAALLEHLGQSVRIVSDGPAALQLAEEWRPALVFLDLGLPDMDGYAIARELLRTTGDEPPVIVALTGYGQDSARARSLEAGFFQHRVKPPRLESIQAVLAASYRPERRGPTVT
jgi:signal transduction histidine kinase/ActR/RegA family two-component response regulator